MQKFIPYEKLSKKEKRKRDALRWNTWGALNPALAKVPIPGSMTAERHGNGWTIHIPFRAFCRITPSSCRTTLSLTQH